MFHDNLKYINRQTMTRYYAAVDIETGEIVLHYTTRKKLMSYLDPTEEGVRYVIKSFKNHKEMGIRKGEFKLPAADETNLPF